jgi:hypothetical protein
VLNARLDDGLSVAVDAPALYDTTAATGLPPDVGVTVKLDAVMVAPFIASLNVTTMSAPTATPVAVFDGETFVTVGGVTSAAGAAVVNVELKAVSEFPARSFAPVETLTV